MSCPRGNFYYHSTACYCAFQINFHHRRAENDASPPSDSSDDGPPEVDVSLLERKNYVTMLVLAMCPSADLQNDEKTRDLNVRAWKMEEEIFGMAINDSEYRKMIIDKVQSVSGAK